MDRPVRFVNLTGHGLNITIGSRSVRLRSEGRARINSEVREIEKLLYEDLRIPLLHLYERSIEDLPAEEEGVIYVVSGIVATAAGRPDVVAPSRIVRQENGRVTECRAVIIPSPMGREEENGEAEL